MSLCRFICAGLTTEGYDSEKGIEVFIGENGRIWWFRVPKDWVTAEIYRFVCLFFFRVKKRERNYDYLNIEKWIYSDDAAKGHKSNYNWIQYFLETVQGVHGAISANVTGYCQVADDPLCNGYFKSNLRREGRKFMRDEIIKSLSNEQERKNMIGKVDRIKMDEIVSIVHEKLNGQQGISNIRKAFRRKLDPAHYDKRMKDALDLFDNIKDKPEQELFPDKNNYYNNLKDKNTKYKNIPEVLLNYKHPKKAYLCQCGWMFCNKYDKKRIKQHNKTCAIHSHYGVVPAYDPDDINDTDQYIQEFIGYKKRLSENKCIFKLQNRWIEYTDGSGIDIKTKIIRDMGKGIIVSQDNNDTKRVHKLKDLRYHNTRRIWRNYRL